MLPARATVPYAACPTVVPPISRTVSQARGDEPADLVLTGGRVLSVFTGELLEADIAIAGEHVAAIGPGYEGLETTDERSGGGQVAVSGGRVLGEIACPIGGLLSDGRSRRDRFQIVPLEV